MPHKWIQLCVPEPIRCEESNRLYTSDARLCKSDPTVYDELENSVDEVKIHMSEFQLHLFRASELPTPTVTGAERLAARVMEGIDAAVALIPGLESPHPATTASARAGRTVTPEFIRSMIGVVDGTEEGRRLTTMDTDDALAMLQFRSAFRPVANRVEAIWRSLNHTMDAWKARVAAQSLQTYAVLQALNRRKGTVAMASHLRILHDHLGRRNGARKKPQP